MAHEEGSNGTVNLLSLFPYFFIVWIPICIRNSDPDPQSC